MKNVWLIRENKKDDVGMASFAENAEIIAMKDKPGLLKCDYEFGNIDEYQIFAARTAPYVKSYLYQPTEDGLKNDFDTLSEFAELAAERYNWPEDYSLRVLVFAPQSERKKEELGVISISDVRKVKPPIPLGNHPDAKFRIVGGIRLE